MNIKKELLKIRNSLVKGIYKKQYDESSKKYYLPTIDKIELLKLLYTYYHGDKSCTLLEYTSRCGSKVNGGGDYSLFEKAVNSLGYNIKEIVFVPNNYKLKSDADAFENRKKTNTFLPREVNYFVLSNKNNDDFILIEKPINLELLAISGDKRAIGTLNNIPRMSIDHVTKRLGIK